MIYAHYTLSRRHSDSVTMSIKPLHDLDKCKRWFYVHWYDSKRYPKVQSTTEKITRTVSEPVLSESVNCPLLFESFHCDSHVVEGVSENERIVESYVRYIDLGTAYDRTKILRSLSASTRSGFSATPFSS
jgi:hypothetical protein